MKDMITKIKILTQILISRKLWWEKGAGFRCNEISAMFTLGRSFLNSSHQMEVKEQKEFNPSFSN